MAEKVLRKFISDMVRTKNKTHNKNGRPQLHH